MWPTVRQSAIETLQHFIFIKLLYNFSDDMNRCALNSQGGSKVPVLRHFLKRMPNAPHTLSLCAIPILLLLLLGFNNTAYARDPLIVYSQDATNKNQIYYSQYQSGNWTTGASAVTDPNTTWEQARKVARIHPDKTKQVVVWKNGDQSGRRNLYASFWDGTNWDNGTGSPYGDVKDLGSAIGGTVDNDYQSFDAAFEQSSGDLMVVTGYPNVNTLWYWTWSGGSWSGYQSASVPNNSSVYRWTKLAPQPGTDKIGFIGMGENIPSSGYEQTAVSVAIWNGSAWGNTSTPYSYGCNNGTDAIDIQAVRSGTYAGDLVAVWARGQYVYGKIWRENLGSWGSNTEIADLGTGKRAQWLKLKPNPNGDNLILAIGSTYVRADTWTTTLNVNASLQLTRASGSFVTDGFVAGDSITMSGFANAGNNVTKTINTVNATTITVTSTTGMVQETGGGNERIKCIKTLDTGAATINVNAAGRTFTQAAGGYTAKGFAVGDQIITSGFTNAGNNTVKTIQTVTDTVITVTDGTGLVNETGNANERIQRTYSLYTITYDGDSRTFGSISSALESALYGNPDYNRPFDIVWDPESGSSNVLLVYSDLWGLRYITSSDSGSSWGSEQTLTSSYQAYWVQLERVPGMTYMGIHDNADDLRTWTWASSTWTAKNTVTTDLETGYNTNREVEGFAIATNSSSTYKLEKHIAPLQGDFYMSTTNTNYADLGTDSAGYAVIFNWDATKYTGATVYFEAVLKSWSASGTAYAKLYDVTASSEVANSEVSITSRHGLGSAPARFP